MADEDEWKKLPTDQKVQHKAWKARAEGYKECIKNFRIWDETSPEFNKYLGLMKKFVTDSNELIRIQGVEAALLFVENANVAKKTCGEVVSGVILKCFNTKPRLKEAAIDLCLMYIEIDKNDLTQEELVKGFSNKQPKVATACLEAITKALSLFGSKVIQVKPVLKEIPALADHRDKNVREATKALAVEIYRWVGPAIKSSLQNINSVMLKELEEEWMKAEANGRSTQTRFMRSQQDLREKMEAKQAAASAGGGDGGHNDVSDVAEQPEVDPYDLLDPVEILSKLPKNFYDQIEAKKWQERKEMLELCQKLCENPKIEAGDYGDLVKVLKKVVSKDTNVMLVTIAAKCLAGLANGIRKKFHPYANVCTDAILEKFKEKKPTVVAALQEAIDAIYMSTNLQGISETCIEYLENKNPSIREQTGLFLARALSKTKSSSLTKGTIKPIIQSLLKNIDHSAPNVRDGSYKALGTLLKLTGEKMVMPFLIDLDNLKMEKIKEYSGKAEIQGKSAAAPKQAQPQPMQKSSTAAPSKSAPAKSSDPKKKVIKGGQKKSKVEKKETSSETTKPEEPVLSDIAVEDQIAEFLSSEVIGQLSNSNWKERLEGLQNITQKLKLADVKTIPCQALIKTLGSGKQGWKDLNFNCLNEKFAIVKNLAENAKFSKTSADLCLNGLIEKIGDVKCGNSSKEAVTAIAEATNFAWVSETVLEYAMSHKNPKIQSESLNWLSNAIKEFGIAGANVKLFIAKIKIGFAATNPAVRTAAFSVMSVMTLYIGAKIRMFFENEKPALLQQIDTEIEKCKGESPPAPTRGKFVKEDAESDGEDEDVPATEITLDDLVTRVNIADKITDGLVTKLADKNWKMRREALEEVTAILNEAKFVEPTIGELASAMKHRLADSNKILVTSALAILSQLSVSLGQHCKVHVKTIAPGLVGVLADSKPNVRQAGLNAMNQWLENTNLSLWFEDEIMSSALSVPKHTFLRIELLNWLTEKLLATSKITTSAKEGLEACVKHLYSCCEDRTGDVRAKAHAALPAFIYHLGMDKMVRFCGKLSPASLSTMQSLLEKAKDLVPVRKPKQSKKPGKSTAPVEIEIDVPASTATEEESSKSVSRAKPSAKASRPGKRPASSKKQQDDVDLGPALNKVPNGKEQRIKDEQKLKSLKWVFDAPREELVVQLKTQMTPCVSSGLFTELFHADFQHHLKALTILTQALENQWEEMIGMLDLILRWATLRFYEKNTTVHMKCLEYIKTVFGKLDIIDFRITDYEANAFIPHLITKIGEPKENIRKDVHAIILQITKVYPAGKVFSHLMQGLVTKNSRQKTECLDELGSLITSHGIDVCQPTPPKALREVATHIGDRDNSVRSAALNVIVCAYNTCGDIVYKYVGKMNEKNMSMLEERIKRSGKFSNEPAPVKIETKASKMPSKQAVSQKAKISTSDLHSSGSLERKKTENNGTIKFDESEYKMPQLLDTSCDDLINEPDVEVPPRFVSRIHEFRARTSNENVDSVLNVVITSLASSDIDTCLKSTHQICEVLKNEEKREFLKARVDQMLTSSCIQFRMAPTRFFGDVGVDSNVGDHESSRIVSLYKSLLAVDVLIFKTADLAVCASQTALQDFIQAVIVFMIDKRVEYLPNGARIVAMLNVVLADLFVNANPTYVLCALMHLLHSSLENSSIMQQDLLKKCVWRVVYLFKDFISPPQQSPRPSLQPKIVLATIHDLQILNTSKQSTNIYKTVRAVVVTFCQVLGMSVLDEIKNIDDIESSELMQIITRCLKAHHPMSSIEAHLAKSGSSLAKKENVGISNGNISPEKQLSMIMKKVCTRELTKIGCHELYDFKQQYPDFDIESQFKNVTPLFVTYINRSLQDIEEERKKGVMKSDSSLKFTNKPKTAKEHLEHIQKLRARLGLPAESSSQETPSSRVLSTNTSALNHADTLDGNKQELHAPVTKNVDSESSNSLTQGNLASSTQPPRPASTSNMENLKRRLEKIKRESRKRN